MQPDFIRKLTAWPVPSGLRLPLSGRVLRRLLIGFCPQDKVVIRTRFCPADNDATGAGQRCGRFFTSKNRPHANPVRGVGGLGVTGIAECRCDGEVGCPMLAETTTPLYCAAKC